MDITFDLTSIADNLFFPYDENLPANLNTGSGISVDMEFTNIGMVMPMERYVIGRDFETMSSYLLSAPLGIADCNWIESAVYALESNATDQWADVRTVPFSLDIESDILIWAGAMSSDWFNPANWDVTRVPTQNDHVIIRDAANLPVIETGMEGFVKNITIAGGAQLTVRGSLNGE